MIQGKIERNEMYSYSIDVSCIGHPYEPLLAVSGIDHTIKIFSPDEKAQADAQEGINISSANAGSSGYSSLSGRRRRQSNDGENSAGGLSSRRRMDQSYQICSQNDAQRQGGMRDAFITVRADGLFARFRTTGMSFVDWIAWSDR